VLSVSLEGHLHEGKIGLLLPVISFELLQVLVNKAQLILLLEKLIGDGIDSLRSIIGLSRVIRVIVFGGRNIKDRLACIKDGPWC
jgi:hypothetical protein